MDSNDYFGGEPTFGGELVPGDDVELRTELRRGRSASSMDIERDKRPKPTKPASIGKPETKRNIVSVSLKIKPKIYIYINRRT